MSVVTTSPAWQAEDAAAYEDGDGFADEDEYGDEDEDADEEDDEDEDGDEEEGDGDDVEYYSNVPMTVVMMRVILRYAHLRPAPRTALLPRQSRTFSPLQVQQPLRIMRGSTSGL